MIMPRRPTAPAQMPRPWLAVVVMTLAVVGCSGGNLSDLQGYVEKVKARDPGPIEPLPDIKQVNTFVYDPGDRRDPFVADQRGAETASAGPGNSLAPDPLRRKEELEGHSLDALRMVGTLEQNETRWGLIKTQDGTLHRVRVGNYMGTNNGQIVSIGDESIQLTEIVSDGPGEWREREATVSMTE